MALLRIFTVSGSAAAPTVVWSLQSNSGDIPGWTGYTSLLYDPVSRRVLSYLIPNTSTSIYSTDLFAYDSGSGAWTRLGGTQSPSNLCNNGSAATSANGSPLSPWPPDRHPVQQMAIDTQRNRLWLFSGVCQGNIEDDLWFYALNANPTANRWTKVTLSTVPSMVSGGLIYSPDDDVLVLSGPQAVSSAHETWVYCPSSTLSARQSAAGCSGPNTWTKIGSTQPTSGLASLPNTRYDTVRHKLVQFHAGAREVWEYDIPSQTWTNRHPSGLPTETDQCCPEQAVAYLTTGSLAGKFIYHQTSHTPGRAFAKDYLYDPAANAFTALDSTGGGPQKLVYLTWDAGRNAIVAWSYVDGVASDVWQGVVEGDVPRPPVPATPTSLHVIK